MNEVQARFSVNQSRPEEITMKEDLGHVAFMPDDGFGDLGFDDREILRDASNIEDSLFRSSDVAPITGAADPSRSSVVTEKSMEVDFVPQPPGDDGFGDEGLADGDLLEGRLFDAAPQEVSVVPDITDDLERQNEDVQVPPQPEPSVLSAAQPSTVDQTTLVADEEEAFALEPLDASSIPGTERRPKRKRKLIVDSEKSIPSDAMKAQLSDTSDIVTTLDLAPPTKRLLHWKETGGVNKLFAMPGRPLSSKVLTQLFVRNIVVRATADEEEEHSTASDRRMLTSPGSPEVARDASGIADAFDDGGDQSSTVGDEIDESVRPSIAPPPEAPECEEPEGAPVKKKRKSDRVTASEQSSQGPEDGLLDMPADGDVELPSELSTLPVSQESVRENGDEGEDKRLNKRTQQMASALAKAFEKHSTVSFKDTVKKHTRKQAAAKFYTLLVLCKQQMVTVRQDNPYDDIVISKGKEFGRAS